MTKSSKRRLKNHVGCMWGLVRMFSFRRSQMNLRLLGNRKNRSHPFRKSEMQSNVNSDDLDEQSGRMKNSDYESGESKWKNSRRTIRGRWKSCEICVESSNFAGNSESDRSNKQKMGTKSLDFDERVSEFSSDLIQQLSRTAKEKQEIADNEENRKSHQQSERIKSVAENEAEALSVHPERLVSYNLFTELTRKLIRKSPTKYREEKLNSIYVEAKRHLSEFIENRKETEGVDREENSTNSLGMILFNEDENLLLPTQQFPDSDELENLTPDFGLEDEEESTAQLILTEPQNMDTTEDCFERPSPVSVLEVAFVEEDISPSCSNSSPEKHNLKPVRLEFEETEPDEVFSDSSESESEFVISALRSSTVPWDEFFLGPNYSEQLLDPSMASKDRKLLLDCANEVLVEICNRHITRLPWLSMTKPCIQPLPDKNTLVREAWNLVQWHLSLVPPPRTLDQLAGKDLSKSGSWMNLLEHSNSSVIEVSEMIFDDLIDELD